MSRIFGGRPRGVDGQSHHSVGAQSGQFRAFFVHDFLEWLIRMVNAVVMNGNITDLCAIRHPHAERARSRLRYAAGRTGHADDNNGCNSLPPHDHRRNASAQAPWPPHK
jgi:hypothetical protein